MADDQNKQPQSIGSIFAESAKKYGNFERVTVNTGDDHSVDPSKLTSFAVVYFGLASEFKLNLVELVLLCLIISFSKNKKNGGYCYASQSYFGKMLRKSNVTIAKALNNLLTKNLIEKDLKQKGPHGTDKWKPSQQTTDKLTYIKQKSVGGKENFVGAP